MPDRRRLFTGTSFRTTLDLRNGPEWGPLQRFAATVWARQELRQFHPDEFMYMAAVHGGHPPVTVRLYKHIDTRRYLNLDDAGHAYAYQFIASEVGRPGSGGHYRRYRSVVDALDRLDLQAFEGDTPLFRSFPPEEWSTVSIY